MIVPEAVPQIFQDVPEQVKFFARILRKEENYRIYAVNQRRGRCYYNVKVITIPTWVITSAHTNSGKKTWYIAHELAHAYDLTRSNHGAGFMEALKDICPKDAIHWELGYKPRNAAAAGIQKQ
jgi:predicted metal-dependent hydrolase